VTERNSVTGRVICSMNAVESWRMYPVAVAAGGDVMMLKILV